MKTNLFLLFFLSLSLIANAQLEKGKFVADISGNFSRTFSDMGVTTNVFYSKTKELNTQINLGYCISTNVVAGVGFGYSFYKSSIVNEIIDFTHVSVNQTEEKLNMPIILGYLNYHKAVLSKLYIGVDFEFGYGWAKSHLSYSYASRQAFQDGTTLPLGGANANVNNVGNTHSDFNLMTADLSPRITYFTGNHFGVFLNLGGAGAAVHDEDFDTTQWIINFEPKYWSLGFEVKFN